MTPRRHFTRQVGRPALAIIEADENACLPWIIFSGRVFAASESMNAFTPHDEAQNPIPLDKSNPLLAKLDAGRGRDTVEIYYCSTLDERWTLRARVDAGRDNPDASLSDSVGDYLSAVGASRAHPKPVEDRVLLETRPRHYTAAVVSFTNLSLTQP